MPAGVCLLRQTAYNHCYTRSARQLSAPTVRHPLRRPALLLSRPGRWAAGPPRPGHNHHGVGDRRAAAAQRDVLVGRVGGEREDRHEALADLQALGAGGQLARAATGGCLRGFRTTSRRPRAGCWSRDSPPAYNHGYTQSVRRATHPARSRPLTPARSRSFGRRPALVTGVPSAVRRRRAASAPRRATAASSATGSRSGGCARG